MYLTRFRTSKLLYHPKQKPRRWGGLRQITHAAKSLYRSIFKFVSLSVKLLSSRGPVWEGSTENNLSWMTCREYEDSWTHHPCQRLGEEQEIFSVSVVTNWTDVTLQLFNVLGLRNCCPVLLDHLKCFINSAFYCFSSQCQYSFKHVKAETCQCSLLLHFKKTFKHLNASRLQFISPSTLLQHFNT